MLEIKRKYNDKPNQTSFKKGHGLIGNGNKGKHWKIKDTSKMGKHLIGTKRPHSEEAKRKNREWHTLHPNKVFKETSIEIKVEQELIKRDIIYQKQVPLCKIGVVDFYL